MLNRLLALLIRFLIGLRYRVEVQGIEEVLEKGNEGILFLPNHPALIDPIIVTVCLVRDFQARVLADEEQVERPGIAFLAKRARVLRLPSLSRSGAQSADKVRIAIEQCVEALKQKDNLILYPAGRIYRGPREQIGANSAVERILQIRPETRIVLVRTTGLWGSRFSWAWGKKPLVVPILRGGIKTTLLNGIFFGPRRRVTLELVEAKDLPRQGTRKEINAYLESFYNSIPTVNTYVPYRWWERGGVQVLSEPELDTDTQKVTTVSPVLHRQVLEHLQEVVGIRGITESMSLTKDLGLDSLAAVELVTWIETEYGHAGIDIDSLQTVGDVIHAANGEALSAGEDEAYRAPRKWRGRVPVPRQPEGLSDMTVTEAFLFQAHQNANRVIVADTLAGAKTYREMIVAILLLRREFSLLPGRYLGIMLPASAGIAIVYLATLFSGKIPVMVNWTLGRRNIKHALDALDVRHIVTARALLTRLGGQGVDLGDVLDRFVCLEDLREHFDTWDRLQALVTSYVSWKALETAKVPDTVAVLFTSGSEAVPKAVPLTHKNIMSNVSDAFGCLTLTSHDALLGILPPFHSFGLTVSMILPLSLGVRAFYYANPTHGGVLGQLIETYALSILVGTPTFLNGIVRVTQAKSLQSLRLVVSGAEKCPQHVYDLLAERCPYTKVLEGYGVTECSPVISVNRQWQVRPGTIGKPLSAVEHCIVDVETMQPVSLGKQGMLLVRGDSVFNGYLHHEGESPFVSYDGKEWYRTEDLVVEDAEGVLTFCGRLKRFIKLGGEMISLPAIETILQQHLTDAEADGPELAIVSTPNDENPEIVLFSTQGITREQANQIIRDAGYSGLHNIRQAIEVDTIPILGTGKIDYKGLANKLVEESQSPKVEK